MTRIIYGIVIAVLSVTAIVIGLIAANNRQTETPDGTGDGIIDGGGENEAPDDGTGDGTGGEDTQTPPASETGSFISPVVGRILREHSLSVPVFSQTLLEWRVHTGIDVSTEEGAEVFAAASGVVSEMYEDPLKGYTVVISHTDTLKSVYSNLDKNESAMLSVGTEVSRGDLIGKVGDSSVSEMADEAHLHFEVRLNGVAVNPLDYISEDAKSASLGIKEETEA